MWWVWYIYTPALSSFSEDIEYFSFSRKVPSYHFASHSYTFAPNPGWVTVLIASSFISFSCSWTSYKWNHMVYFCSAYFCHLSILLYRSVLISVTQSNSLWPRGLQHARLPCPSPTPIVHSHSCPLSRWCHPAISSSVIPFSFRLQSFPASGSFPVSCFFTSGDQSIGVSASTSVFPMHIQDWFPLEWTTCTSLQSNRLSRVSSNTTVQKHQFFGAQLSL